ncbi:MAG: sigma-54-dependent transcriptional regulator [Planctomycetota bacterium]|jgi:DNA-binding NtrC family response regulator
MAQILILDDEQPLLQSLSLELGRQGHDCLLAETGREAFAILEKNPPDLAILDVQLPDVSGLEVLRRLRRDLPEVPVLIITAYASVDSAVEAMKEGAIDYLEKPLDLEELQLVVTRELKNARLRAEVEAFKWKGRRQREEIQIIGRSPELDKIRTLVDQLATIPFESAAELPTVLIQGETGTGKDLLARFIHYRSPLADHPFVQVNCSGLPRDLIESELFGHEKGSFTGATQRKQGLFEVASGGTIFLDEIGDMPLDMQTKLLNVLESKRARRVGGTQERPVDVRIIAATNAELEESVRRNEFRSDLYYRLKVVNIELPALRDRAGDVPLLIEYFLTDFRRKYRKPDLEPGPEMLEEFSRYRWPGNIRELAHTLERVVLVSDGNILKPAGLEAVAGGASAREASEAGELRFDFDGGDCTMKAVEKHLIEEALRFARGNVSEVARLLGVTRGGLRHRMEKWGIEAP